MSKKKIKKNLKKIKLVTREKKSHKPVIIPHNKLKGSFQLLKESLLIIKNNYQILSLIMGIYAIIYLALVLGFSVSGNATTFNNQLKSTFHGSLSSISKSFNVFGLLLNASVNNTTTNSNAGIFQGILFIIISLVLIYSFRKLYNGSRLFLKEAFYNSMYPLIPYLLVMLLISVELIPLTIALALYNYVITGGIAVGFIEKVVWAVVLVALGLVSFYFICSSIFALFIISLERMTPMKALRSAKNLVRKRRTIVTLKLLFLPIVLFILIGIIMLVVILIVPVVANWILQLLLLFSLLIAFSYLYNLYRNLLDE